ncbi:MAG: YHYH protein [Spirochaetia bacterium]|nr:YHYH protein [Spirochaetia bacterium]
MKLTLTSLAALFAIWSTLTGCSLFKKDESDDDTTLMLLLLAASSSTSTNPCSGSGASTGSTISNTTATIGGDGCISGVTTSMDSALPTWIKNNFKCSVGYVVGDYYCFKSKNLPNHTSFYWTGAATGATLSAALTNYDSTTYTAAGTNRIGSQNFVYAIPKTPTKNSGTLTGTQGGLSSIGITLNGLAIFNNAAAPGDVLATEATTFDSFGAHPNNQSITHHHAWIKKYSTDQSATVTTNFNMDSNLIGVALDGYAIYGAQCDNGTAGTGDDFTPTLDSLHGHTAVTQHFSTATYHYHYVLDSTATIKTLMGSYFYGKIGAVSN